jgi:hypothetical protein
LLTNRKVVFAMKLSFFLILCLLGLATAGLYPSLGASIYFPPDNDPAIYYHGGLGYAFPDGWDAQLGIGYVSWTHNNQDYSIMPLMGSGTYHFLPPESILDLNAGLGLGYAWRHWGDLGNQNSPCGEAFVGTALSLGRVLGLGVTGGYLMDDLGHPDQGGFGLGFNLGLGIPF